MKSLLTIALLIITRTLTAQQFADNESYESENDYCLLLKSQQAFTIEDALRLFDETPLDSTDQKQIFRMTTMGGLGDPASIEILKIEGDSTGCTVTIKLLQNARRNEIMVHSRRYSSSVWNKFQMLADTAFWNQPKSIPATVPVHDGQTKVYECITPQRKHSLVRSSATGNGDELLIRRYLFHLLEPIFEVDCKPRKR